MIQKLLSLLCCFIVGISFAQKKAITHDDYDLWKYINGTKVSDKGKLVVFSTITSTKRGDGYLEIYDTETQQKATYFNGYKSAITKNEKFVIFQQKATYATKRAEKKEKTKKEDQQKDVLYIYDASNNTLYDSILRVKKYSLPKKNSDYLVIEKFKNKKDSIKGDSLPAWKNNYALIYNLKTKRRDTIFDIKDVAVPEHGTTFYYTTKDKKNDKKAKGVYAYNLISKSMKVIDTLLYDYKKLNVNKLGNQLTFIAERDSVKTDSVPFKLFLYKENKLKLLVENEETRLGTKETLSDNSGPFFSEDGKRLYFYSKLKSEHKKDTTLLDDEIPQVDVWNWQDKITQPRQKAQEESLKEDTRFYYFDTETQKYVQLRGDTLESVSLDRKYAKKYILGYDSKPYQLETWTIPWKHDYYVVNIATGEKRLLVKGANSALDIALNGEYAVYFDLEAKNWFSVNLETLQKHNLTKNIKVAFEREDHDTPTLARAYGSGGYDKDGSLLLYDKYDIWKVSLDGRTKPKNITKKGRRNKITFRTSRLDNENRLLASYLDGKLLLNGFNEKTKTEGIYLLDDAKPIEKIKSDSYLIFGYKKAVSTDVLVFRKENFNNYGDLYVTTDNFKTYKKISDVNPQQKEFKWGTSELVSWKAYDGTKLEGIVYKPEDFDPSKKYPMIVYFYEKSASELNYYYIPSPSASTVDFTYSVSNDYIVFVPDIVYKEGQPGKDAYNCVISGVEAMEKKGYIDSDRMALQGQSWGGYQVAYLITKTNKFKAAMAGAPVSNMTSAYGGIRWASGLSRMFQYEKTQSRIGKNLWEGFDLYVESSPLFSLPSVETPLLIMHNDNDGAVPYYQGIELFMGMRRLQKPAWLLVYNNESHNLRKTKNKQDLSIRMMQFFDHYLKDAPAPMWMTKGVPRAEKGINFGYDLDKD
ncbi:S9 family peptidase [Kordia sp. YSTF-M3]|uniref:S9 family peptidase n=1 Tax=Kordia aestuariivivens TaxID=2759037 RepID=A0ABR7Q4M8_9FLAO|nr:prolyl oligopeptidase family serine peptidase [Kordia aestuariivivens]MBC8753468.1 S9 family peptidase [Kordia aestuariivivens]